MLLAAWLPLRLWQWMRWLRWLQWQRWVLRRLRRWMRSLHWLHWLQQACLASHRLAKCVAQMRCS